MNYYEHHIGDYAEATAHLSFVEDAAYSRLIRKYYSLEGPLPADMRAVQRLICARTEEERAAVETVLSEFFTLEPDGWHQSRCDAEVERFRAKSDKARNSASKRWNATEAISSNANASNNDANASINDANALPTQSEGNAKAMPHAGAGAHVPQSPDTNHQKETPPNPRKRGSAANVTVASLAMFEKFWQSYPRKDAKKAALSAWVKLNPDEILIARMRAGLARCKASDGWLKDQGKFIPMPATWLNGERWNDQPQGAPSQTAIPLGSAASVLTDEERANTRAAMEQFQ